MQKSPQTKVDIFLGFQGFSWQFVGPKPNLRPLHGFFSSGIANPKSSMEYAIYL